MCGILSLFSKMGASRIIARTIKNIVIGDVASGVVVNTLYEWGQMILFRDIIWQIGRAHV